MVLARSGIRPPTIHDVALRSGVAVSTVSRALSQSGRISETTRRRIRAAAEDLGYVPNRQARALSAGRTGFIGVFIPDLGDLRWLELSRSISHELRSGAFSPLLAEGEGDPESGQLALEQLHRYVDGMIIAGSLIGRDHLEFLESRLPLVLVGRQHATIPSVPSGWATPHVGRAAVEIITAALG